MSILSVYKPGYKQHSKCNVWRHVCFEKRIKYVNKATCSMLQKITLVINPQVTWTNQIAPN
jgi:hypothetical protein